MEETYEKDYKGKKLLTSPITLCGGATHSSTMNKGYNKLFILYKYTVSCLKNYSTMLLK